jgi:type II secretory pathway pseudopilin PulG
MFSLIIAVIAIVLVGLLALATMYYLNNAGRDASATSQSALYLQEGSQLVGALEVYKLEHDGSMPTGTEAEIKETLLRDGKYLKSWPEKSWRFSTDYAFRAEVSTDACAVPSCSDTAYEAKSVCCSVD